MRRPVPTTPAPRTAQLVACVALLWWSLGAAAAFEAPGDLSFVVVVHPDNAATSITREELTHLLLARRRKLGAMRRSAKLILPPTGVDGARESLFEALSITELQFRSAWQRAGLSSTPQPGPYADAERNADVVRLVHTFPNAIGILVDDGALPDKWLTLVRVLDVEAPPERPE